MHIEPGTRVRILEDYRHRVARQSGPVIGPATFKAKVPRGYVYHTATEQARECDYTPENLEMIKAKGCISSEEASRQVAVSLGLDYPITSQDPKVQQAYLDAMNQLSYYIVDTDLMFELPDGREISGHDCYWELD